MSQKESSKIIGIDLGTNSCFAVMEGKDAKLSQMQRVHAPPHPLLRLLIPIPCWSSG